MCDDQTVLSICLSCIDMSDRVPAHHPWFYFRKLNFRDLQEIQAQGEGKLTTIVLGRRFEAVCDWRSGLARFFLTISQCICHSFEGFLV